MKRGQFIRALLSSDNSASPSSVIGAAKSLTLHVSVSVENASTKDTDDDWIINEPTTVSYDISISALVRSNESITSSVSAQDLNSIMGIYEASEPVKWQIANMGGANNRSVESTIVSGSAVISGLTINAQNRQTATYDVQLQGYGAYTVGSVPSSSEL